MTMLTSGNGDPRVCAVNLLRTVRGEVPMARTKGIGREHIDAPATRSDGLRADAEWVLETYEPRLSREKTALMADEAVKGDFELQASVRRKEEA